MRNGSIARSIELAGLISSLCFISPRYSEAGDRFSASLSGGVYVPPNEEIGLGGIPLGGSLEIDYGDNRVGFVSGAGAYFENGFERIVRDWRRKDNGERRIREKDEEDFIAKRVNAGLRLGNRATNLSGGLALVEDGDRFETKRRTGVFGYPEETSFPSSEVWYGPYLQLKIGKVIDSESGFGLFFKWGVDYLTRQHRDPVYSIRIETGVSLAPRR